MNNTWQRQRGELNHQWLTNQFLVAHIRGSLLANLTSRSPELEVIKEFAARDWPVWAQRRGELAALLDSAEASLSPRQLFDQPPLQSADPETKAWMSEIVHALWLARTAFHGKITATKAAFADVDGRYRELDPLFNPPDAVDIRKLQQAMPSFQQFETAVLRLTDGIHSLPRKILVV